MGVGFCLMRKRVCGSCHIYLLCFARCSSSLSCPCSGSIVQNLTYVLAGTIINYSILGEPQLDSDLWSHSDNQIGMGWNLLPRILVKRFFENCIKKYRTLEWVPVLGWNRDGVEIWDASSQDKEALEVCPIPFCRL